MTTYLWPRGKYAFEIDYDYTPGEAQTYTDPGYPGEFQLNEVWLCLPLANEPGKWHEVAPLMEIGFLSEDDENEILDHLATLDHTAEDDFNEPERDEDE